LPNLEKTWMRVYLGREGTHYALFRARCQKRQYALIHCWMKIANVQTVLKEFTLRWRLRNGGRGRGRWIGLRGGVGEM
jgi:hypothetical protein